MFNALNSRAYFEEIIILYPNHWDEYCFSNKSNIVTSTHVIDLCSTDVTLENEVHPIFGSSIRTKQFGQCGDGGKQIYINKNELLNRNAKEFGKEFVQNWAKYRYGVFDEYGFLNDKIYPKCYVEDEIQVTGCSEISLIAKG